MKKVFILALTVALMLGTVACGKKDDGDGAANQPKVADIMASIQKEVEFPEMADIPMDSLSLYIELDTAKISEMGYVIAGSGATADELLIVKMNSEADATEAVAKMEIRKTMQTDLFSTYNPDEADKLSSAVITSSGSYAMLAITNDNAKAKKLFTDAF